MGRYLKYCNLEKVEPLEVTAVSRLALKKECFVFNEANKIVQL